MKSMVNAINHVTLAVQDLDRSFSFYTNNLGAASSSPKVQRRVPGRRK